MLVWICFIAVVIATCQPQQINAATVPKVNVDLYYESLCPYCRNFIKNQLWPTYQQVKDIMNISLVPFGNAVEKETNGSYSFTCQHGKVECVGNMLEACAIKYIKNVGDYLRFIVCFEEGKPGDQCITSPLYDGIISKKDLEKCVTSRDGELLVHKHAVATMALKPKKHYVPWIVINGVHTEAINQQAIHNLLGLVCKTYNGTQPAACKGKLVG